MNCHTSFLMNLRYFFVAAVFFALQVCAVSFASAANYSIYGRVYSAARFVPGQTPPDNPLSTRPPGEILKDKDLAADINLYAVTTKSMVWVSVQDKDGMPLATSFLAKYSGGYNFNFSINNVVNPLTVKLVVRDAISNQKLMESETAISASANNRYLLVEGEHDDVGNPHPGTNLFTMVGKIPNDGTIINSDGLANVPPTLNLGIPKYQNAPFGGTLDIAGALSSQYYPTGSESDLYCYKPSYKKTNEQRYIPIKSPLYKTRYTLTDVGVKAERILVGPKQIGSVTDCYAITPIAQTQPNQEVFWSIPDQLIRWNTASVANGKYQVTLTLYDTARNTPVILSQNAFSNLTLQINNTPVVVEFTSIANGTKNMLDPVNACDVVDMALGLNIAYKAYHAEYPGYYKLTAAPTCCQPITLDFGTSTPAGGSSVSLNNSQINRSCAYIFGLFAVARTTNGYWNFNQKYIQKAYYLKKP